MFASARSVAGSSSVAEVGLPDVDRDAVRGGVPLVASTACGSKSTASTGSKPSFAAAIASTPEPQPTSSTLPRSSPASSSRQSCVVGCAPVPNARPGSITTAIAPSSGSLPRRPDPERADADGLVELPPAVLPVVLDDGRRGAAERLPDPFLARSVRVGGELEPAVAARSPRSPPGRARSSPPRACFGPRAGTVDRDAAQERSRGPDIQRMLSSFSKKPSSRRYVSSSESVSNAVEQLALLVGQLARDGDVDEHPVVAAAEALEHGMPLAAQHAHLAGLRARRRTRARARRRASAR